MRAMILAAGRGERMGELTTHTPKALLRVGEKYLIEYAIANLKRAGISEIVINISYHAEQIKAAIGDGKRYGVAIQYSFEEQRLETGGGIFNVLPFFDDQPFIVISSDIITDYPLQHLPQQVDGLAYLIMVCNPLYHLHGDFGFYQNKIALDARPAFTFANIAIYHPGLFAHCQPGHFRLTQLLIPAISSGQVTGELYHGLWYNIGTPADLTEVNLRAREDSNLRPLASETNTLSN